LCHIYNTFIRLLQPFVPLPAAGSHTTKRWYRLYQTLVAMLPAAGTDSTNGLVQGHLLIIVVRNKSNDIQMNISLQNIGRFDNLSIPLYRTKNDKPSNP